jgi:ABC-type uncharacterized transport system involved in gliding motility auxiliary subunit
VNVLNRLEEPVKITGFFTGFAAAQLEQAQDQLQEYTARTDKITVEFVDPDQRPSLAREMGIQTDGTLVFQLGDKKQEVLSATESQITGALLKLISDKDATVYFVGGHGERSVDDFSDGGLGQFRAAIEKDNFKAQALTIASASGDEWKQGILVINTGLTGQGGSTTPLLTQEKQGIQDFLKAGGKALLLLGPNTDPSYNELLAPYGLKLAQGVALDPSSSLMGDIRTLVVSKPESSTLTEGLPLTVYPLAAALVDEGERPAGVTVQPLMQTTAQAWLETDLRSPQPRYDEGTDVKGPLRLAVTIEGGEANGNGRLVVVTSPDAAANGVLQNIPGNQDFLLNAVNWLAQAEENLGIRPREDVTPTVILTPGQSNMILLSAMGLFPGLIVLLGLMTWWSRR